MAIAYGIMAVLIHIIVALAVNGDAKRLVSNRGELFLFGPFLWGWIVLVVGIAGFALYWVIHHSSLRAQVTAYAK